MRPMGNAKSVVYINFSQTRQLLGKFGIVFFFLFMETQIFQKQNFALIQRSRGILRLFSHAILDKLYFFSQNL